MLTYSLYLEYQRWCIKTAILASISSNLRYKVNVSFVTIMAIQSIPDTIQNQVRGTNSSSSLPVDDEENQHHREFGNVCTDAIIYITLIVADT